MTPTPEKPFLRVTDYTPCDICREVIGAGIHVIGVSYEPYTEGILPILKDEKDKLLYPTGSMMVVKDDFIYSLIDDKDRAELIIKEKKFYMPEEIMEQMIKEAKTVIDLIENES